MQTFAPRRDRPGRRVSFEPTRRNTVAHSGTAATTLFGHDFGRIPVHAKIPAEIQTKPTVNAPGDAYEQEADRVAEQVMNTPDPGPPPSAQRETAPEERKDSLRSLPGGSKGGGSPLPDEVRAFMEPRFGFDFGGVRVHTDRDAGRMSRSLNARAFTHQQHIYFGAGRSPGKDATTAHELAHVLQQTGAGSQAHVPSIQRVLEVRPPGRGEASAYGRRQELIDRLNTLSTAIQYGLDGNVIRYTVSDEAALTHFDRQMRGFIDRAEVVPMRLITRAGLVDGLPLWVDSLQEGYLDDTLASDDLSFQMNLIHLLTERFAVRNYERRIGTPMGTDFRRAHRTGLDAEAEHLRTVLGDPTIRFLYEETRPNGTDVFAFRSDEGYRVFHVFRGRQETRATRGGEVFVRTRDGRRLTIEEFLAERASAAPATAPASAPATAPSVL